MKFKDLLPGDRFIVPSDVEQESAVYGSLRIYTKLIRPFISLEMAQILVICPEKMPSMSFNTVGNTGLLEAIEEEADVQLIENHLRFKDEN